MCRAARGQRRQSSRLETTPSSHRRRSRAPRAVQNSFLSAAGDADARVRLTSRRPTEWNIACAQNPAPLRAWFPRATPAPRASAARMRDILCGARHVSVQVAGVDTTVAAPSAHARAAARRQAAVRRRRPPGRVAAGSPTSTALQQHDNPTSTHFSLAHVHGELVARIGDVAKCTHHEQLPHKTVSTMF